jgi:23S rRNA (adenine2503-C2)-methyltransferase
VSGYARSAPEDTLRFQSVLKSAGFESEIRVERGGEIDAACGQLKRNS